VTAPKPSAPRVAALRERRAAFGLARLEVWARPEHHALIRAYAAALHDAPGVKGTTARLQRPPAVVTQFELGWG